LIIGTATLAALIGAGGLGSFILLGIDRNAPELTLIGAIGSALLAIIFSTLIRYLQHLKPRYTLITLAAIILLIGGVSFSQSGFFAPKTITIAGKLGSEPDILINMYKELIEQEDPDAQVELEPNFGKTSFLFSALDNDQVDIYPEFTGTVLESLVDVPEKTASQKLDSDETYTEAVNLLQDQFEMTLLQPMAYQNTYALAVKKEFAEENGLTTISDLKKIENQIKAGFTLEFIDRTDGYAGIQELYGLDFPSVQSMEPALRYQAINNGDINLLDAYSTDSELRQYGLVILEDDQELFPPYQGAPLMKEAFAKEHPEVVRALEKLAGKITEEQMSEMNYQVNVEGKNPAEVARTFLIDEGLIKEGQE
jgi:osmoprotectant transport system permease protein